MKKGFCYVLSGLFIGMAVLSTNTSVEAKRIGLNISSVTLEKGETYKLNLKGVKKTKVSWKSNKKRVATVSKKGVVKAKKKGTCVVSARYKGKKYNCNVEVISSYQSTESVAQKEDRTSEDNTKNSTSTERATEDERQSYYPMTAQERAKAKGWTLYLVTEDASATTENTIEKSTEKPWVEILDTGWYYQEGNSHIKKMVDDKWTYHDAKMNGEVETFGLIVYDNGIWREVQDGDYNYDCNGDIVYYYKGIGRHGYSSFEECKERIDKHEAEDAAYTAQQKAEEKAEEEYLARITSYDYEAKFVYKPYTSGMVVYVKTNDPGKLHVYASLVSDDGEVVASSSSIQQITYDVNPLYREYPNSGAGGYGDTEGSLFAIVPDKHIPGGYYTLKVYHGRFWDPDTKCKWKDDILVGEQRVYVYDADAALDKWIEDVLNNVTTDSMTNAEKMHAVAGYLSSTSTYVKWNYKDDCPAYTLYDMYMPFWYVEGDAYELDSQSSVTVLELFADYLGYPTRRWHEDLDGSWSRGHAYLYATDGSEEKFGCCHTKGTGIDAANIPMLDFTNFEFYDTSVIESSYVDILVPEGGF